MKYIQDTIKNSSRSVFKGLTKPQKKSMTEIIRGLFVVSEPILRHLAQHPGKSAKRQADKYSHHLKSIDITKSVDESALKYVKPTIKKNTIISYDLCDIAKKAAKKIERLSQVWDGSLKRVTDGFLLHGVGVHGILLKFLIHEGHIKTINQVRKEIVKNLSEQFKKMGIWVFDRGNDAKSLKVQFIARLRENRLVAMKETGTIYKLTEIPEGKYEVYLMNDHNNAIDTRYSYTLVIRKHLKNKLPIRLLAYLKDNFSAKEIVEMYLERWGIENIFKRAKTKFCLEKIRVLKYQKFVNLVSLIQFAVNVSTIAFINPQRFTNSLISGALLAYKRFIKRAALSLNVDSFITFLQKSLKPFSLRIDPPLLSN